jgi:phage host-nuclease inhibitor protein Gam
MELEIPIEESSRDRFQYVVIVLILLVTILGAVVALLQTHASVREDQASRESVALAVQLVGKLQRSSQRSAYELGLVADFTAYSMDALAVQATALELEMNDQSEEAAIYCAPSRPCSTIPATRPKEMTLYQTPRLTPKMRWRQFRNC